MANNTQPTPALKTALTQDEINARIAAAAERRAASRLEKINNSELVKEAAKDGIRVYHLSPNRCINGKGMTIAYRAKARRPAVIEIATAICHKNDTFFRKEGTRRAIANFRAGRTTLVPGVPALRGILPACGPIDSLRMFFRA